MYNKRRLRSFNPFYAELCARLCQFERKYKLAAQFGLWDKIKVLDDLKKFQVRRQQSSLSQ